MKIFKSCEDGVHKFEGRWDETLPSGTTSIEGSAKGIKAIKDYKYIKDVCVKCGKEILK